MKSVQPCHTLQKTVEKTETGYQSILNRYESLHLGGLNRRIPNGTYGGVRGRLLLDLDDAAIGRTYAQLFFDESKQENDPFHQFVLDAVYKKEQAHSGFVTFTDQSNKRKYLRITSSFLKNEEKDASGGVVLVLSDITETELLRKKHDLRQHQKNV